MMHSFVPLGKKRQFLICVLFLKFKTTVVVKVPPPSPLTYV